MTRIHTNQYASDFAVAYNMEANKTSTFAANTYHHSKDAGGTSSIEAVTTAVVSKAPTNTTTYYLNARAYTASPKLSTNTQMVAVRIA